MKIGYAIQTLHQTSTSAFSAIDIAIEGIVKAARTSDLTGLPNILAFEDDFADAQKSEIPRCLLFGDLNGFKSINDSISHDAGDATLVQTAKLLEFVTNNWQATAYHRSGDEFAILVATEHKDGLVKDLAQHLAPVRVLFGGRTLEVSGSFGCVQIDTSGEREILERAELACQIAKSLGASRVVHEWSKDDTHEAEERRLRCSCGTAFRCTLVGDQRNITNLHCPVCKADVANKAASELE